MKYLGLLFIAVSVVAVSGCKKELLVSDALTGTWELRQDGGGWSPVVNHKAGNDTLAVFTSTNYSFYQKGNLFKSGTYTIRKDSSYLYGKLANRIIFDGNDNMTRDFFEIKDNQLGFWLDANDAPTVTYQRIK